MAINIKDPETDALARRLALLTDETITETIRESLRERLERLETATERRRRADLVWGLLAAAREQRQAAGDWPAHEGLDWDESGLPV